MLLAAAMAYADEDRASGRGEAGRDAPAAWLGVLLGDAVDGGVRVVAVISGGPADRAGIRSGDLLIGLDGVAVTDRDAIGRVVRSLEPGRRVVVQVVREGRVVEERVSTGARPQGRLLELPGVPPAPETEGRWLVLPGDLRVESFLGAELVDMSPELRAHYGAPAEAGVLVAGLREGATGARNGLRVGDVLVRLCGSELTSSGAANPCLTGSVEQAVLAFVRGGRMQELKLELPERYARAPRPDDPSVAIAPVPRAEAVEELRIRLIQEEIERLEKRLADLRRELERLQR